MPYFPQQPTHFIFRTHVWHIGHCCMISFPRSFFMSHITYTISSFVPVWQNVTIMIVFAVWFGKLNAQCNIWMFRIRKSYCDVKDMISYNIAAEHKMLFLPTIAQKQVFRVLFSSVEPLMSQSVVITLNCVPETGCTHFSNMQRFVLTLCTTLLFMNSCCYGCLLLCFQLNENVSDLTHSKLWYSLRVSLRKTTQVLIL